MGKTVFIHPAGRQPLAALAPLLARAGWQLFLNELNPLRLAEVAEQCRLEDASRQSAALDPAKGLSAAALFDQALSALGCPQLVLLAPSAFPRAGLLQTDEWDFQRTFESNVTAVYLLLKQYQRVLPASNLPGTLVYLRQPSEANPVFQMTQAAVGALLMAARADLQGAGVRISLLDWEGEDAEALLEQILALLPPETDSPRE